MTCALIKSISILFILKAACHPVSASTTAPTSSTSGADSPIDVNRETFRQIQKNVGKGSNNSTKTKRSTSPQRRGTNSVVDVNKATFDHISKNVGRNGNQRSSRSATPQRNSLNKGERADHSSTTGEDSPISVGRGSFQQIVRNVRGSTSQESQVYNDEVVDLERDQFLHLKQQVVTPTANHMERGDDIESGNDEDDVVPLSPTTFRIVRDQVNPSNQNANNSDKKSVRVRCAENKSTVIAFASGFLFGAIALIIFFMLNPDSISSAGESSSHAMTGMDGPANSSTLTPTSWPTFSPTSTTYVPTHAPSRTTTLKPTLTPTRHPHPVDWSDMLFERKGPMPGWKLVFASIFLLLTTWLVFWYYGACGIFGYDCACPMSCLSDSEYDQDAGKIWVDCNLRGSCVLGCYMSVMAIAMALVIIGTLGSANGSYAPVLAIENRPDENCAAAIELCNSYYDGEKVSCGGQFGWLCYQNSTLKSTGLRKRVFSSCEANETLTELDTALAFLDSCSSEIIY